MNKSICYIKMKEQITKTMQTLYCVITATEITEKYFIEKVPSKLLDVLPKEYPYTYFNVSASEYIGMKGNIQKEIYQDTYISLISILEAYLYDVLNRYFSIYPDKIKDETHQTSFSDLYLYLDGNNTIVNIIDCLVDLKLRNRKTIDMFNIMAGFSKCGVMTELKNEFDRINEHSLVRNSIIHNDGYITNDLMKFDNKKYQKLSGKVDIGQSNCVDLCHLIFKVVKRFEIQYLANVILDEDKKAICKEIYRIIEKKKPFLCSKVLYQIFEEQINPSVIYMYFEEYDTNQSNASYDYYRNKLDWLIFKYVKLEDAPSPSLAQAQCK